MVDENEKNTEHYTFFMTCETTPNSAYLAQQQLHLVETLEAGECDENVAMVGGGDAGGGGVRQTPRSLPRL